MHATTARNLLLSSLSSIARELITARCTAVALPIRTSLSQAGREPTYAFFMTSGIASVVVGMRDGGAAEVGMMGRKGVAGALHLLGPTLPTTDCFMQLEGTALRIPLPDLRRLFETSGEIRLALLHRVQIDAMMLAQVASCHRLHEAEERLARWLLTARDLTDTDTLDFTQEFLAEMLGSRRATVTMVAGAMQRSGLIEYRRGRVHILDRAQLEAAACDCYGAIRQLNNGFPSSA